MPKRLLPYYDRLLTYYGELVPEQFPVITCLTKQEKH